MVPLVPALLTILLHARPARAADPDAWLDAVVMIENGAALCAGAVIDADGTVATAYHCVTGLQRPRVETRAGARYVAEVRAISRHDDVALLSVPGLAGSPVLPIREAEPRIGEEVWALGHPMGSEADRSRALSGLLRWSATRGVISAVGPVMIQVDSALNPGNSGGPVVDADGAIVGVASRKLKADNLGFAARASAITALLPMNPTPYVGGTYGFGLNATLPVTTSLSPSFGAYGEIDLRETLILRGEVGLPLDARWSALSRGESQWVGGSLALMGRGHLGSGAYTVDFAAGPALTLAPGRQLRVSGNNLWFLPTSAAANLGGRARLGFGGGGVTLTVGPWSESLLWVIGVDLAWPGTVGVW